jgi:hypothetical protein
MKLLYKPFAVVAAFIASRIGKVVFKGLWSKIDERDPPAANAPHASLGKVIAAATLEAATMAGIGAAADRASARAFHYLTGTWPGEDPEES